MFATAYNSGYETPEIWFGFSKCKKPLEGTDVLAGVAITMIAKEGS